MAKRSVGADIVRGHMDDAAETCEALRAQVHYAHGDQPCGIRCHMYKWASLTFLLWDQDSVGFDDLAAAVKILWTGRPM